MNVSISVKTDTVELYTTMHPQYALKHRAILYNEAKVFSLSITIPNGWPLLPFDWLIHLILILMSCHRILFFCLFSAVEKKKLKTKIRKKIQTDCEGNIFYRR